MINLRFLLAGAALCYAGQSASLLAQDAADTARIIDEGMNRSQVQQSAHELLDQIGQRLTNSPNMRLAEAWATAEMQALGLDNVHKEGFEFGRGWEMMSSDVRMVAPRALELSAIPVAWTPGTNGTIEAEIIVAPISEVAHFEAYRGKLAGKIVLYSLPGTGDEPTSAAFSRLTSAEIGKLDEYAVPQHDPQDIARYAKRREFALKLDDFLASEGAVAWVKKSYRDGNLLHGSGYTYKAGKSPKLPGIEIAAEDYRRLARLARTGPAPRLSINSNVRFVDDDTKAYNILGEIRGTDPAAGYVMAGAHFDSWAAGDGAVDNGAGSITVLEAARILKQMGVRPRRTIRFALWSGEEQGLLGSLAYVRQHLVSRAGEDAVAADSLADEWRNLYPITPKPGYSQLKAYFNMDNGSGKFRGIHAEGNAAAEPLLRKWMAPFADMGASTVVAGKTGGTDHVYLQAIGLPGYQFIQDPLDYFARLHHTNIDTFDHLRTDDLRQASVVMAGMLLAAANDKDTIAPMPLPQKPLDTDPFEYDYPED